MTALARDADDSVLDQYRRRSPEPPLAAGAPAERYDELVTGDGVRPGSDPLAEFIADAGAEGLWARRQAARRLVSDDGISYGGRNYRRWELDPLPVVLDADQWQQLVRGLDQRARLLDALLADLYGEQRTLREGVIPPELVFTHPGYLIQAHGSRLRTERQLILVATDLARGADGAWRVIGDRTQAPSGAGYAMANRRVIARILPALHRRTHLSRLRGFFDRMQVALHEVAPPADETPRVALLSPGAYSETAFDQAFTATLLGHPLVQSDDLTMRGGRVWRRTTGRLEPVDVLLRRVDADYCDSLDLRPESRLGVPGMVEAERRGTLAVVNPLGSPVLENPALLPYLGEVARVLLSEELILYHGETWWCGDEAQRSYVRVNIDHLVLRPTWRGAGTVPRFGWELSADDRDDMLARIEAEPGRWTAQEPIPGSTAPVVTRTGLEARSLVIRTFGVATAGSYDFMPGGLARVATDPGTLLVTNLTGAAAKDLWVLAPDHVPTPPLVDLAALSLARRASSEIAGIDLAPRAAENLYWLGRYSERCEGTARLLMVADNLVEDNSNRPDTPGAAAMWAVLDALSAVVSGRSSQRTEDPVRMLVNLLVDPDERGSVAMTASRAGMNADEVREVLSMDTWSIVSRLRRTLADELESPDEVLIQPVVAKVLESLLALSGLAAESLVRDPTWAFVDAGRRVERAQLTLRLLRNTLGVERSPVVEGQVAEAILRVCESLITHRRRLAAGQGLGDVNSSTLQLLVLDETNPRSVAYQVERLLEDLSHVPQASLTVEVRELLTGIRKLDMSELVDADRTELCQVLIDLEHALRGISDRIEAAYFVHQGPYQSFVVPDLEVL